MVTDVPNRRDLLPVLRDWDKYRMFAVDSDQSSRRALA